MIAATDWLAPLEQTACVHVTDQVATRILPSPHCSSSSTGEPVALVSILTLAPVGPRSDRDAHGISVTFVVITRVSRVTGETAVSLVSRSTLTPVGGAGRKAVGVGVAVTGATWIWTLNHKALVTLSLVALVTATLPLGAMLQTECIGTTWIWVAGIQFCACSPISHISLLTHTAVSVPRTSCNAVSIHIAVVCQTLTNLLIWVHRPWVRPRIRSWVRSQGRFWANACAEDAIADESGETLAGVLSCRHVGDALGIGATVRIGTGIGNWVAVVSIALETLTTPAAEGPRLADAVSINVTRLEDAHIWNCAGDSVSCEGWLALTPEGRALSDAVCILVTVVGITRVHL